MGARFGGGSNRDPQPFGQHDRSTVLKSAPPQLGLWAGVLPIGWWGELHNNDPAPRWRLVLPSNTVNKTRRRPLRRKAVTYAATAPAIPGEAAKTMAALPLQITR